MLCIIKHRKGMFTCNDIYSNEKKPYKIIFRYSDEIQRSLDFFTLEEKNRVYSEIEGKIFTAVAENRKCLIDITPYQPY